MGRPGGPVLHGLGLAASGQLLRGEHTRKAHPQRTEILHRLGQRLRREGDIPLDLHSQRGVEPLHTPGRTRSSVAVPQGGLSFPKWHRALAGHRQQAQTVLVGVQVQQHKARFLAGHAHQRRQPVLHLGRGHGHAALALRRAAHPLARLPLAQQHRAAHQRHQHQHRDPKSRPKALPSSASHPDLPFLRFGIKHGPSAQTICRSEV